MSKLFYIITCYIHTKNYVKRDLVPPTPKLLLCSLLDGSVNILMMARLQGRNM